jgi:hypothetical protein
MVALAWTGFGLALICLWIAGNIIGRVVAFPALTLAFVVSANGVMPSKSGPGIALIFIGTCAVAAWFMSGIPTYLRRIRANKPITIWVEGASRPFLQGVRPQFISQQIDT